MATYVLVHGAFAGARVWKDVSAPLRLRGHDVYAPSLTGLGDRQHLASPAVNLSTHVQDVIAVLEHWNLYNVVLVGSSYGGMVVTGVADRAPERIAHLVYLDALLPRDGEAAYDLDGAQVLKDMPLEDGWLVVREETAGMPNPPSRGQPVATFEEKLHLSKPLEDHDFTRTYVKAGQPPQPPAGEPQGFFWSAAARVRSHPAWRYYEIPSGHSIHRELPESVAGILLEFGRSD